jgi:hypothetical protein
VVAGGTPVLVHNCGGKHASGETAADSDYVGRHRAPGTDVGPFYPRNDGFQGDPERTWLNSGDQFDRYGSEYGRFTSPVGTPMPMRAMPPGTADRAYNVYEVVKPFEVQSGTIAPAFGQVGGGTQYVLPLSVRALLARCVIRPAG